MSRPSVDPIKVGGADAQSAILDTLQDPTWPFPRYSIYVIEMNECVWNESSFHNENLKRDLSKPCLYVGMSWHAPEVRFSQHMIGEHAGRYPFRYNEGARLRPDLFQAFNPMHKRLAELMEIERAVQLRNEGFGVWQR
jgi:hypothetical protein